MSCVPAKFHKYLDANFEYSGDSYTRTAWSYTGTLPSSSNPFGNPAFPGTTSANGLNWIQHLTTTHNSSLILTYNFAIGGATIDNDLVTGSTDVAEQVEDRFIPNFSDSDLWEPPSTLFSFWVGINDVEKSYLTQNSTEVFPKVFIKYADLIDQLYETGARNFLILNVPSIERSPRVTGSNAAAERIPIMTAAVALYNSLLLDLVSSVEEKYGDATVFHVDTYKYFDLIQSKPKAFIETSGYRNTDGYCSAYTQYVILSLCQLFGSSYWTLADSFLIGAPRRRTTKTKTASGLQMSIYGLMRFIRRLQCISSCLTRLVRHWELEARGDFPLPRGAILVSLHLASMRSLCNTIELC